MTEPFEDSEADSSSGGGHPGLPKSTMIVAAAAIALAGLATFIGMLWSTSLAASATLRETIAARSEDEAGIEAELTGLQAVREELESSTAILHVGQLAICNESTTPIVVSRLAATWENEEGEFQSFSTEPYGRNLWTLVPGERQSLSYPTASWYGEVSYYAVWLTVAGEERPYSGAWPTAADYCIRVTG